MVSLVMVVTDFMLKGEGETVAGAVSAMSVTAVHGSELTEMHGVASSPSDYAVFEG